MSILIASLRKELLLQWRSRAQFVAVFVFGAVSLLLFSFAIGPDAAALRLYAGGFLWLAILLGSTLALAESFSLEIEQRALEGMLLLPLSPRTMFYAKALANWVQLFLMGVFLLPLMVILYDAGTDRFASILLILFLGTAGLAAPGTLYAAMAAQARAKGALLPLLLFPLVVPVLLASVKSVSLMIMGDPMNQARSWLVLLVAFNAIYWALCGLLFPRVIEE